ncbi:MAG: RsfS/YbeB/iojap family protein [Collinsella intestinalis]
MTDMTDDQLLDYASGLGAQPPRERLRQRSAAPSTSGVPAIELARAAADAASFKGAEVVCIIDLTELSDVCDCFVLPPAAHAWSTLSSARSRRRSRRHSASIRSRLRPRGAQWILMDYGWSSSTFTLRREYCRLEKLWGDAPVIEL